jgi:RNA polymerase sigma-70 factor (ECF subfamily)
MEMAFEKADTVVDLAALSDHEVLGMVLGGYQPAWLEFIDRFQRPIGSRIGHMVLSYTDGLPASDATDDLVADFYVELLRDDMRKLRAFDLEGGRKLSSWLCMLATRFTIDHYRKAEPPAMYPLDDFVDCEELGDALDGLATNRGAAWMAWWS